MGWEDWDVAFCDRRACKEIVKNCEKGTMIMKPQNVNCQDVEKMLTSVVFPTIVAKWPPGFSKTVSIQQDNAKPHCKDSDPVIKAVIQSAALLGFTIKLENQPPSSSDLNVLDLAFFASIQSIQHKIPPKNTHGLVEVVLRAFQTLGLIVVKMYGPSSRWSRIKSLGAEEQ